MNFTSLSGQALQKGLDAAWLKTKIISSNIANYDTPGYKAKNVDFAEVMSKYSEAGKKTQASYRTVVYDDPSTSMRVDGNNVSMEKEQLELWKTYSQYAYMIDKISGEYNKLSYVIKNTCK